MKVRSRDDPPIKIRSINDPASKARLGNQGTLFN